MSQTQATTLPYQIRTAEQTDTIAQQLVTTMLYQRAALPCPASPRISPAMTGHLHTHPNDTDVFPANAGDVHIVRYGGGHGHGRRAAHRLPIRPKRCASDSYIQSRAAGQPRCGLSTLVTANVKIRIMILTLGTTNVKIRILILTLGTTNVKIRVLI